MIKHSKDLKQELVQYKQEVVDLVMDRPHDFKQSAQYNALHGKTLHIYKNYNNN